MSIRQEKLVQELAEKLAELQGKVEQLEKALQPKSEKRETLKLGKTNGSNE